MTFSPLAYVMTLRPHHALLAVTLLSFGLPSRSAAQVTQSTRPSATDAAALLQARPELLAQLRDRIGTSGLTPTQVRARLRAEGYPENLLDAYLEGGNAAAATGSTTTVFSAIRALGLADDRDIEEMQAMFGDRPRRAPAPLAVDTLTSRDKTLSAASAELFGLALFREATTRFQPNLDGPVDAGYRIGPGDELVLILTGDVEAAHTLEVTRGGFVVIPQVGQIGVANLTLGQLEDLLYARLGRVYSGVQRGAGATTHFSLNVSKLRSNQVFVVGDVVTPGAYRVSSAGTALTALYAAGGPSERGSLRRVEIRRGGKAVANLDVYDYLLRGDASQDVRLQQGDVLFVPVRGARVRIDGEVTRPATYELKAGETLVDALIAAGGLRVTANGRRVLVDRILPRTARAAGGADRASIDIPLGAGGSAPAFALEDGDVLRVPGIADRVRNRIVVSGHVWSPGPQGFAAGLTLTDALRRAGGVKPDAYLGRVLVSRLLADSTRIQLRATLRDSTGVTVEPLLLQEDDEIIAYSRTAFRPDRYVAIGGAVLNGGRFPWRAGMTMRDLVLLAGGLSESAYLREAEIARLPEVRDANTLATTIRVPLDSGYLFADGRVAPPGAQEQLLQPYDNVLILRNPDWRLPISVQLLGEVRFPGQYTLRNRNERLSDLIDRAGGITSQGDASAGYFTRRIKESLNVQNRVRVATAKPGAIRPDSLGDSTRARSIADEALRLEGDGRRIRVGVDLAVALRAPNGRDNLFLEEGDSLFVPVRQQTVSVRGEVNAPTALVATGRSLGAYLSAAGGATERGNTNRAYVIQPNGKIESRHKLFWLITLDPTPKPGATVVVPSHGDRLPGSALSTLTTVVQTLTALATVVVLSRR